MDVHDALGDLFTRIRRSVPGTVGGLDAPALAWRPDPQANSIAWLVWHLTRVQDDHVAEIAQREQVWVGQGWAERFGLPAGYRDTGYGHSAEQVAAISPGDPRVLVDYHEQVADQTAAYLQAGDAEELDRVIDRSYDPPVTVGVRLVSVIEDSLQHLGQAAYLRGLHERRVPAEQASSSSSDVALDELPDELRSRILAATAHAEQRRISRAEAGEGERDAYRVEAVTGDLRTIMNLALRADGSVAETTRRVASADAGDDQGDGQRGG